MSCVAFLNFVALAKKLAKQGESNVLRLHSAIKKRQKFLYWIHNGFKAAAERS